MCKIVPKYSVFFLLKMSYHFMEFFVSSCSQINEKSDEASSDNQASRKYKLFANSQNVNKKAKNNCS